MTVEKFTSESELCATFAAALPAAWVSYAETGGYDLLLVRKADGFQIGLQAKLSLNAKVVDQSLDYSAHGAAAEGPDCRGVLVPEGTVQLHLGRICAHLGITVVTVKKTRARWDRSFSPELPTDGKGWWEERNWHELGPARRVALPAYVPDIAAGAPAPMQLTDWKIKALKIVALLEIRGFVTRHDFSHLGLDHRRWLIAGEPWLVREDGVFKRGPRMPDFGKQHPAVYAQVKAEASEWAPKTVDGQKAMF